MSNEEFVITPKKVKDIPERMQLFNLSEETIRMIEEIEKLSKDEILMFPISERLKDESILNKKATSTRYYGRAKLVVKRFKDKEFKVNTRGFDIYVQRLK